MTTAEQAVSELETTIREMLTERFNDTFIFNPIVVIPRVDHDGDHYLHAYIVFEGDQTQLDAAWTLGLSGRLWRQSEQLGFPGIPMQSFVEKSEWKELEGKLRWTPGT